MSRLSFTMSDRMAARVVELSQQWGCSESETLRRVFGLGDLMVVEAEAGHKLLSENPETGERTVFKTISPGMPL